MDNEIVDITIGILFCICLFILQVFLVNLLATTILKMVYYYSRLDRIIQILIPLIICFVKLTSYLFKSCGFFCELVYYYFGNNIFNIYIPEPYSDIIRLYKYYNH